MSEIQRRRSPAVMNGAAVRRPEVIEGRYVESFPMAAGEWETMIEPSKARLAARLQRGAKRREYGRVGRMDRMESGLWYVNVWRIRPEAPAWRRPAIIAGCVVAVLASIAGLGWWAMAATASALEGKGDTIIAGLTIITIGALVYLFRRPMVEVTVRVWK